MCNGKATGESSICKDTIPNRGSLTRSQNEEGSLDRADILPLLKRLGLTAHTEKSLESSSYLPIDDKISCGRCR